MVAMTNCWDFIILKQFQELDLHSNIEDATPSSAVGNQLPKHSQQLTSLPENSCAYAAAFAYAGKAENQHLVRVEMDLRGREGHAIRGSTPVIAVSANYLDQAEGLPVIELLTANRSLEIPQRRIK